MNVQPTTPKVKLGLRAKMLRPIALAAATACALTALPLAAHSAEADLKKEIEELRRQNEMITQRLADLERRQSSVAVAPAAPGADPTAVQRVAEVERRQTLMEEQQKNVDQRMQEFAIAGKGDLPKSWKIPGTNTSVRLGGFAAIDGLYDIAFSGGTTASFSGIPISGTARAERKGTFQMHAQNSRVYLDLRTQTKDYGQIRTYVDFDFSGRVGGVVAPSTAVATAAGNPMVTNSYIPRLRYAYMDGAGLTFGQTDTTFVDASVVPFFFDPSGPTGITKIRQGVARYTVALGEKTTGERPLGTNVQFALENPEGDFTQRSGPASTVTTGTSLSPTSNQFPDLHARLNLDRDWGHLSLAGLYRKIRMDDGLGNKPSANGWGLMAAWAIPTWGKDKFSGQIVYGDGIGRYIPDAANSGATSPNVATLSTQTAYASWMGYTHWWSPQMRSAIAFGGTHVKPNVGDVPAALVQTDTRTFHANISYQPTSIPDLLLGIEYVWGKRELLTGQTGYLRRATASAWYFF